MTKVLVVCLAAASLAFGAGQSFRVTLFQPSIVGEKELKPGDYKIELQENKMVIRNGKESIEAPVKVETSETKFGSTSIRYRNGEGKYRLQEIRIGGTKTILVLN